LKLKSELENAAKVKPKTEELRLDEELATPKPNTKLRRLLIFGGSALLVIVAGLFIYYFNRESTDDAQWTATSRRFPRKSMAAWREVLVDDNQPVKAGELL